MSVRSESALLLRQELPPPQRPGTGLVVRVGRRLKAGVAALFWIGAGVAVITYGAALVYANVARVEVDSAIVAGIVEAVEAPAAGRVESQMVVGAALQGGDRLFNVVNPDIEEKIGFASVRVERARSDLNLKIAERDAERSRRDNFLLQARGDLARSKTAVSAFLDLEKTAQNRFDTTTELFAKGYVTRLRLEDVADKLAESKSSRIQAQTQMEQNASLVTAVEAGQAYGGQKEGTGHLADAEAAARRAAAEVKLAAEELAVLMMRRTQTQTNASSAGRILRILKLNGTSVQSGDPVALIERDGDRVVYAFLTQSEVGRVAVDDDAEVVLPAQHLTAHAKVIAVERSGGYLDDVESRYVWKLARDPGIRHTDRDRTARVTLRFASSDQAVAKRELAPGTPAFVSFRRNWEGSKVVEAYMTLEQLASRTMNRLARAPANPTPGRTKVVTE